MPRTNIDSSRCHPRPCASGFPDPQIRGINGGAAKAEWLGEFRDDVEGWLLTEVIEAAVDRDVKAASIVSGAL